MKRFSIKTDSVLKFEEIVKKSIKYGYSTSSNASKWSSTYFTVWFVGKYFGLCHETSQYGIDTKKNRFDWSTEKKKAKNFMKANIGYKGSTFKEYSFPSNIIEEAQEFGKRMGIITPEFLLIKDTDSEKQSVTFHDDSHLFYDGGAAKQNKLKATVEKLPELDQLKNQAKDIQDHYFKLDGNPEQIKEKPMEVLDWKDLKEVSGFTVDNYGFFKQIHGAHTASDMNQIIFATHAQALGSIAMAMLSQLLKDFNKDDGRDEKTFCIKKLNTFDSKQTYVCPTKCYEFLGFASKGAAQEFLRRHEDLIQTYFNAF